MRLFNVMKRFWMAAAISSSCVAASAQAALITLDDVNAMRVEDTTPGGDGTGDIAQFDVLDIGQYSNNERTFPVFVFQMVSGLVPNGSGGVSVSAANFLVTQTNPAGTPPNGDAYALRTSANTTILASDYENFSSLLMSTYSNNTAGAKALDAAGQTNLATYLQNNWVEGDYVFIGLKTNPINLGNLGGTNVGRFGNSGGGWTAGSTDAQLTATVVPEPSSLALLAFGGVFMWLFKGRRGK